MQPVEDHDGWYRNPQNGGLQSSDQDEYHKFMKSYNAKMQKQKEQEALQNDVSQLKSDMSDIKSLLLTLVQNQNHDN